MMWLKGIFLFFAVQSVKSAIKNTCTTFQDYARIDSSPNCYHEPDVGLNTPDILRRHVGHFERHTVTTEDGYILTMFRIPQMDRNRTRGVVVLQHPMSTDAVIWVGQSNESLAFLLWHEGFDVWLPNNRGTYFSAKHVNLTVDDYEYWDFDFHEIGLYDYDSFLSYIKVNTQRNDLIVIGHSMAGTATVIYASMRPEKAKDTVKVFIEWCPVVFLKHTTSPLVYSANFMPFLEAITKFFRMGPMLGTKASTAFNRFLLMSPLSKLSVYMISFLFGWTPEEYDPKLISLYLSQNPRGVPWKVAFHYAQIYNSNGKFSFYDYGPSVNMERYKSVTPPEYPISEIKAPIYLVGSTEDTSVTVEDLDMLLDRLSPDAKIYGKLIVPVLNHIDFHFGRHRKEIINDKLFAFLLNIGF